MAVRLLADYIRDWSKCLESTISVIGVKVPVILAIQITAAMARDYNINDITDIPPLNRSTSAIPNRLDTTERQGPVKGKKFLALRHFGAEAEANEGCENTFQHSPCHDKAFDRDGVTITTLNEESINEMENVRLVQRITSFANAEWKTDFIEGTIVMEMRTKSNETLLKQKAFPKGNPINLIPMDACMQKFEKRAGNSVKSYAEKQIEQGTAVLSSPDLVHNNNLLATLLTPR